MELPQCPEHGQMELQKPGTREQEFCGTWYRCTRCTNSVLFTSPELENQLAEQRFLHGPHRINTTAEAA